MRSASAAAILVAELLDGGRESGLPDVFAVERDRGDVEDRKRHAVGQQFLGRTERHPVVRAFAQAACKAQYFYRPRIVHCCLLPCQGHPLTMSAE